MERASNTSRKMTTLFLNRVYNVRGFPATIALLLHAWLLFPIPAILTISSRVKDQLLSNICPEKKGPFSSRRGVPEWAPASGASRPAASQSVPAFQQA